VARVAIGIGSNDGDARVNVLDAFVQLQQLGTLTARSSLYRTKAWGVTDQADFYNAAAILETNLEPHDLLRELKRIEREMGRTTTFRWGPRIIDLDILTYDDRTIDDAELQVPHILMNERAFVLVPLAEIDPTFAAARSRLDSDQIAEVRLVTTPTSIRL
jgi:2-amino-4-hydroxy-6-hydroxymethyldihydropteridine diphosphokinase